MAILDFNAAEAEPSRGAFQPLPGGPYIMKAVDISEDDSKGYKQLVFIWEIVSDINGGTEFAGMNLYQFIITHHQNADAERIGRERLSAICVAACPGKAVSNTDMLLSIPVVNVVKFIPAGTVDKGKNGRRDYTHEKDSNEITAVRPLEKGAAGGQRQAPARQPAPQQQAPAPQQSVGYSRQPAPQQEQPAPSQPSAPWRRNRAA